MSGCDPTTERPCPLRPHLRWVVAALAGSSIVALAQPQNLDDLQKQLDQAKQQKEAQQPKPTPPANKSDNEPRPAAATPTAGKSTLVVEADAPCELRIDGQRKATLKAKEAVVLAINAGKQLVVCTSSEAETAEFRSIVETRSGAKDVLQISLASVVQEVQRKRDAERAQAAAEAERKAKQEAHTADCAAARTKFTASGSGVLRQCGSNFEWTQADIGRSIDWSGAQAWCAGKGSGWDLPTVAELDSIYNENAPGTQCGTVKCRLGGPFQLTSSWFWSRDEDGPSRARIVHLGIGINLPYDKGILGRALCVRRS